MKSFENTNNLVNLMQQNEPHQVGRPVWVEAGWVETEEHSKDGLVCEWV